METNIKILLMNGTVKDFRHVGRSGGSYTKSIRYEGVFAIVTDEWGNSTAIPASEIEEIQVTNAGGRTW